ncbi:MAG: alanine--tRNA ligase [Planctomycetes bacterium]|nr:alanine--tRNA ligase [Planctomycetota bacterium]
MTFTRPAREIRQGFIDFFAARGHEFVPSSSVLPEDPTLLFANAGMNQFKDVFLGTGRRPYKRAANSQKCIRAGGKHNDLEDVGWDTYHQTFFEMLGNWSFGDYYKKEAIEWAWELLTKEWGLPRDRLYATVFREDEEAASLWPRVTGIPAERVLRFGEKDNFWEMAETGPCGPCSEIHIDLGEGKCPRAGKSGHVCGVNTGCPRYIELWNLVFIQYNRAADRKLSDLPARHVDTGMGLERVTSVIQGVGSNYSTDLFTPILAALEGISGKRYSEKDAVAVAFRAIADHVRTLAVAIADGALPGPGGRGYVLRRILRRAVRFGRELGMHEPFLVRLVPAVVEVLGAAFPEISARMEVVSRTLQAEENAFEKTIDRGLDRFQIVLAGLKEKGKREIPAEEAFALYDRDGFPIDLTELMARQEGLSVDRPGFERVLEESRERSRKNVGKVALLSIAERIRPGRATRFTGYKENVGEAMVLEADTEMGYVVLDQTPFYAESGGQIGDTGTIQGADFVFRVEDTQKHGDVWVHMGRLEAGETVPVGSRVEAAFDYTRRERICKNHTATHVLHWALRDWLGPEATQQGSLVAPDRLRFDFATPRALSTEDLDEIERRVNEKVVGDLYVGDYETELAKAKAEGAMALFGEKYGSVVRVVRIGDFSRELCGGTHVFHTGEIGPIRIVSEGPVQAGVRRIVAFTAMDAVRQSLRERRLLDAAQSALKAGQLEDVPGRVEALQARVKELEQSLARLESKAASARAKDALGAAEDLGGVRFVSGIVEAGPQGLRVMGDRVKGEAVPAVGFFVAADGEKLKFLAAASPAAIARGLKAGDILREVAKKLGGGGGGRPDLAEGGGGDPSRAEEALSAARQAIQAKVEAGPAGGR